MTLLLWAASASAVTLTLHFSDGNVDSVQVDESSQIYFYDPDMQVTRLTAPVNGAANVPQLTEFSWQHVADRDVELLISESEDFADTLYLITDIDTNTYTMSTPLEVQKRYYWKVRIEGETLWTAPWYFDTYMPALPEKVTSWMIQTATNGTHIVRNYASKIDSLMILFSEDGSHFNDTLYCDTSETNIGHLPELARYYVKVAGVNGAGIGPLSEMLFVSAALTEPPALIIDGFDRPTDGNTDALIIHHVEALLHYIHTIASATNEALADGLVSILPYYQLIDYILGEESTADETFSDAEQDKIEHYLKAGGKLLVSGAEIAWDLDYKGSTADKAFCHDYLKIAYRQDAPNGATGTYYNVYALGDTIFSDLSSFSFDNGTHGTYNVKYPDVFTPQGDAQTFLKYTGCNTGAAGIVYQGMFPGGDNEGKLMVLGFPFETVYPEAARTALMGEFFQLAEEGLDVEDVIIPKEHALLPNYPNPFNPSTTISLQLTVNSDIELSIYDVNGRLIETLFSGFKTAGEHRFEWNAADLPTSVYVCVLRVDAVIVESNKMILIK